MTIRRVSGGEAVAFMLLLCLAGRAQAQEAPFKDPNFPNASGDVTLSPGNANATRLVYIFRNGPNYEPEISVAFGTSFDTMKYYGYGDEGSWLGDGQGNLYTLKDNVLTRLPAKSQVPKNLRNGSELYRTRVLRKAEPDGQPAAPAPPPAGATLERPHPLGVAPPGSTSGTDARIERSARGATLSFKDGSGEHRYGVRRPVTATSGTDAIDTGGWIYVAPDGKSGMLFNVSANHAVTVMPLAQPMLGMLAGRGGN